MSVREYDFRDSVVYMRYLFYVALQFFTHKDRNAILVHTCVDVLAVGFSFWCGYDSISISNVGEVMRYACFLYGRNAYTSFCSSRIMPSFLDVVIKLPGFRDRIFSVLYPVFVLIAVGRFCLFVKVRVLAFFALCDFFEFSGSEVPRSVAQVFIWWWPRCNTLIALVFAIFVFWAF